MLFFLPACLNLDLPNKTVVIPALTLITCLMVLGDSPDVRQFRYSLLSCRACRERLSHLLFFGLCLFIREHEKEVLEILQHMLILSLWDAHFRHQLLYLVSFSSAEHKL